MTGRGLIGPGPRPLLRPPGPGGGHTVTDVHHHRICRHRIEVEVWPPRTDVRFLDEKWTNPTHTELRFVATVYNSQQGVVWSVLTPTGQPGLGTIDAGGRYVAPLKGGLPSGYAEIVVATSREDPLRKAFAWVTVLGDGPEVPPQTEIEVWPKRVTLYYPDGQDNAYIDPSNTMQMFQAKIRHSATTTVEWRVNGALQAETSPWFLYRVFGSGGVDTLTIEARPTGQPGVRDQARVTRINYDWPGLS